MDPDSHSDAGSARTVYPPARRLLRTVRSTVRSLLVDGEVDRVRLGQALMAGQGAFALAVTPALGLNHRSFNGLLVVSMIMAVLLAASFAVPWRRLPDEAAAAFAVSVIGALATLGAFGAGQFTPLLSFLTLSFVYVGVTQRPRIAVLLAPPAAATLVVNYGELTGPVVIRTVVAVSVWLVIASALAALMSSNAIATAALRTAASIDQLTGVPNRRHLSARLDELSGNETIIVIDLDHFKKINDTAGHAAGDTVLRQFGALLRDELRADDYCARYGGEEFVIILPGSLLSDGHAAVIDRLRLRWARIAPGITFSTGAAHSDPDRSSQATLTLADRALYLAKNAGRNTDRTAGETSPTMTVVAEIAREVAG